MRTLCCLLLLCVCPCISLNCSWCNWQKELINDWETNLSETNLLFLKSFTSVWCSGIFLMSSQSFSGTEKLILWKPRFLFKRSWNLEGIPSRWRSDLTDHDDRDSWFWCLLVDSGRSVLTSKVLQICNQWPKYLKTQNYHLLVIVRMRLIPIALV